MKNEIIRTGKSRLKRHSKQLCSKSNKNLDLCTTQFKLSGVSGNNQNDRLEILKSKCEQEIKAAEENLRVLKAKLDNLILLTQESDKLVNPDVETDKYRNMGYTEAVEDAIKTIWGKTGNAAVTADIKSHLLANGFRTGSNFDTSVYTILKRLLEYGKIGIVTRNYDSKAGTPPRRGYRPK